MYKAKRSAFRSSFTVTSISSEHLLLYVWEGSKHRRWPSSNVHLQAPFTQTSKVFPSPTSSLVSSVCPEAGSDHPPRNAFKGWDRWHSLMDMNECVFGMQVGILRKTGGLTRVWWQEGEKRRVRWGWLWALSVVVMWVKVRSSPYCGLSLHTLKFHPGHLCTLTFLVRIGVGIRM